MLSLCMLSMIIVMANIAVSIFYSHSLFSFCVLKETRRHLLQNAVTYKIIIENIRTASGGPVTLAILEDVYRLIVNALSSQTSGITTVVAATITVEAPSLPPSPPSLPGLFLLPLGCFRVLRV